MGTNLGSRSPPAASGLLRQLQGHRLTTAEIIYRLPDHPALLQTYVWQGLDMRRASRSCTGSCVSGRRIWRARCMSCAWRPGSWSGRRSSASSTACSG